ncbi:MAG TPA: HAMP domain-containing sensor histidine kinase [Allocoleopsis sp.]
MKKLSPRACLAIALSAIALAAVSRSLILFIAPRVWPWFFGVTLVAEGILIWRLFAQNQRLAENNRQSSSKLQMVVAGAEQLQVEKATLESRLKEAEESDRLLKDAVDSATHALKNPLASVRVVLQLLETESLSQDGKSRLGIARSQITVAARLVEDLLDCFRLDANAIEPRIERIDLGHWLPNVVKAVVPRAIARRQTINYSVESCPDLLTDEVMLRKAVEELLTNACKYSYNGAQIDAIARLDKALDKHVIEVRNPGRIGFREQARIWDRFYRIPDGDLYKQGGTGLGLSLTKKIVRVLGGEVSMQSVNNVVTFRIVL